MMIRRRQRELKKLYDSTEEISERKITPVLEGVYPIQGPIDESDFELKKPELVEFAKKNQSSESKIPKIEKGTCNVCSTPCFSCSHLKSQPRFCSELKFEQDQVIKREDIRPSVRHVGNNNMSSCNLTCDPKDESSEEKVGVDGKIMKGEIQSGGSAKFSLVSDKVEEKVTLGTSLADGNEADKMTGNKEDDARKSDMTDEKSENGKSLGSSGDEKESSEAEDSDEIGDDVKVCDICGDVGQDDFLAFCTRCSDGAEHTYCMRVMMDKIPEGEWLCEECQIEVQSEKQKEKQKAVAKFDERREKKTEAKVSEKKPPRRLNSYFQRKEENQEEPKKLEPASEKKMEAKVFPKKTEPNTEFAELKKNELMDMKKKLPAETKKMERAEIKKPEPTDTNKTELVDTKKNFSVTTRDNPILDSEIDKGKLVTSLQRGTLSKSTSFKAPSSKIPKVKQITEVPQNPKITKDPAASNNLRKEPDRIISKSSSFKNPNQSATTETLKKPPPKEPRERNITNNTSNISSSNNKGTSILGRPAIGILSSPKIDSSGAATSQGLDNGLPSGRNELKKPNAPKPSGSLLPRPDDISTCSLLDSILQRNVPLATPRTPRCQRCNEMGHAIQSCPKDPTRLAALKPPSERNAKESVLKRPKFMDQKEHEDQMLRMDLSNGLKIEPTQTCSLAPVVFDQLKSTIIPEVDYIWQGGFELVREGKPPDRYDGFQAHFSSCVSPRVPEIVKSFPFLVRLEEVPRQKTWPVQFEEGGGPTENHIAIYFFARDYESYENCYMKLVESMRNKDLALRGKIGTAELLVFPSNLLPEYSQRWNKLYYLWGIFKGKGANLSKEGSVSTSVQDCNHYENMETESSSKTATENCLKDEPDVIAAVTLQEKKAEQVSISPPFVDLNSCEIMEEPEPDEIVDKQKEMVNYTDFKKAVPLIESDSRVGPHTHRFCEKPTSRESKCCDVPAEEIPCVRSSHVEWSKNTSLRSDFLPSDSSNCPSHMQGEGASINSPASRKRSSSMEPISSLHQVGVDIGREHKKAKTDNGDLNFAFSGNHIKSMEILDVRDNIEKEILLPQSPENNILFPALAVQNRENFSTITSTGEIMVHQNINLESPPRGNSTPDLELALGDTKKSPKKGPMLPFLSSPKVNVGGDGSSTSSSSSSISSRPVQVQDETACLSLSLGFPVVLSDRSGDMGSNKSSGNTDLFPFPRPRDS